MEQNKPRLFVLPPEVHVDEKLFEKSPLYAVKRFLQCFDSSGNQVFTPPQHVLEALAARFLRLMDREAGSLDEAFGGKIGRQRAALEDLEADFGILWLVCRAHAKELARQRKPSARSWRNPLEHAFRVVARAKGMGPDNVRRIWKEGGPEK